jgi:hypothetical protein
MTTPLASGREATRANSRRSARAPRLSMIHRFGPAVCVLALAPALTASSADAVRTSDDPAAGAAVSQVPPPIRLSSPAVSMALVPFSACWSNQHSGFCYDGAPPHPLPSLGGLGGLGGKVTLVFARDGWHFRVSAVAKGGHRTRLDLVRTGQRSWLLRLDALPPGHYRAQVFGRGEQGDVAGAFAFTLG